MSEQNPSGSEAGTPPVPAPAETPSAPAPAAEFGSFGASRGTGLARGKRRTSAPSPAASGAAPAAPYRPTAVQVVTVASEYQNPFAPATPPEPEPAPAPEPTAIASDQAPVAPVAPTVEQTTPAPAPEQPAAPAAPQPVASAPDSAPAEKPVLNILPPANSRRTTEHWESPSADLKPADARPTFQPGRREGRGDDRPRREAREGREAGEGRGPNQPR